MRVKISEIRSVIRRLLMLEGGPSTLAPMIIDALTQFGPMTASQIAEKIGRERAGIFYLLQKMLTQGIIVLTDEMPLAGKKHKKAVVYDIPNRTEVPSRADDIIPEKNARKRHEESIFSELSSGPKTREELMNALGLSYKYLCSILRDLLTSGQIISRTSPGKPEQIGYRGRSEEVLLLPQHASEQNSNELTAYESVILNFLKQNGPSSVSTINFRIPKTSKQNIPRVLNKLQEKGLIYLVGTRRERVNGRESKIWASVDSITSDADNFSITDINSDEEI